MSITASNETLKAYRCWRSKLIPGSKCSTVHEVLDNLIAINADNIQAAYIALFNRMHTFSRPMLEENLYHRRNIGRLRAMRKGMYLIDLDLFECIYSATYRQREYRVKHAQKTWDISEKEYSDITRVLLTELGSGEKKRAAMLKKLPRNLKRIVEAEIGKNKVSSSNTDLVIDWLLDRWQIISGLETWNRTGKRYCLFDDLHTPRQYTMDHDAEERRLVSYYIRNYGPVLLEDIAWWCDLTINHAGHIVSELGDSVQITEPCGSDKKYHIDAENLASFDAFREPVHESCCLLGENDPLLTGYNIKWPNVDDAYADEIFGKFGGSAPAVLVGGEVAGTWEYSETSTRTRLSVELFRQIGAKAEARLLLEIDRLGDFLGGENKLTEVNLTYR